MRVAFSLLFVLLICSCKKNKKEENRIMSPQPELKKEKVEKDDFFEFKKDTFFSNGDQILFLRPSENFFKKVLENEEGIYEVDGDFGFYASKVRDSLKDKYDIKFITQRIIGLIDYKNDTVFYDTLKNEMYYSSIFNSNKKKYKLMKNIYTDMYLFQEINNYYKSK